MFNDENICIFHLVLLVMAFCTSMSKQTMQNGNSESKLSRQRRYLIFPTGSSVQLVYEFGVTIPDYTLYVTTGITVALAWNLPDKPTYPEHVHVHNERIENGSSVVIQNKNDTNLSYYDDDGTVDSSLTAVSNAKANTTIPTYLKSSKNDIFNRIANYAEYYFRNRPPDSYYFGRNSSFGLKNHGPTNYHQYYYSNDNKDGHNRKSSIIRPPYSTFHSANPSNDAAYMIEKYFKPWIESSLNRIKSMETPSRSTRHAKAKKVPEPKPIIKKVHTIYPALKKRYVRETTIPTYEQKFYLDHHRRTRHRLYEIIEKYLFAKGYNGTECVLKTLCEVGQKQHDTQPGSFLVEIVRAVFSLPVAQLQNAKQKRHIDYDNAHQIANDCAINFPLCAENIWNAQFIIESDDATIY